MRLRADQNETQLSRQPADEHRQQQAITGLRTWTPGVPLEDTWLMAEKKYIGLEAGLAVAADEEEVEKQAEEAVEESQEHDDQASSQCSSSPKIRS